MDAFILAFFAMSQAGEIYSPVSLLFIKKQKIGSVFMVLFAWHLLHL